jgi:predicted nucleotidyltransferase
MMISQKLIKKAVRTIIDTSNPLKVILFGSYASGTPGRFSDLDFLVVKKRVPHRALEMIRIKRALRSLRIPVDVIVVSKKDLEDWGHLRSSMLYWAVKEGKVMHEEAA